MKTIKAVGLINLSLIIFSIIFISGCNDDSVNSGNAPVYDRLNVWDYSDNHYFLDTIYKQSFIDYYNNNFISSHTDSFYVDDQSFEVWVQTDLSNPDYRKAALYTDLPVLPSNGYNDSFKVVSNPQQGISAFGLIRKLQTSEYTIHRYAGYVSLKINLPENYFAGVAYRRPNTHEQFGTVSTDTNINATDTLVLKMIKVQNLVPQDLLAWEMKLKNIYQLPVNNINEGGFDFRIRFNLPNVENQPFLPNMSTYLITILGLDKYTNGRNGPPDNKFDFLPGYTIDTDNGWIVFPTLKPFLTNLQNFSTPIDSSYWYPEIYNKLKTGSSTYPNAANYFFVVIH